MAGDKKLVGQLDQLSIRPPTPPLTTSPDSLTPSTKPPFHETSLASGFDIILAELRNRRRGHPQQESEWWCIELSLDEFDSLEARIQTDEGLYDFVSDKAKYDYFPRFSWFVLRMVGDFHEFVLGQFERKIDRQLLLIEQSDNQLAAEFAQKIRATRSPKLVLEARGLHSPDGSWRHKNAGDPGVIIEISYSQKRKDLPFLADDYILGSNGTIQVVIGIDVEYRKKKGMEAKVFVWRPRLVKQGDGTFGLEASQVLDSIFRAEDGGLVNGNQALCIQLKDFGNKVACPGIEHISREITIPFSQLYDIVQEGDEAEQTASHKRDRERREVNPSGITKRQRLRSSPEELRNEDEEGLREQEEEVRQPLITRTK